MSAVDWVEPNPDGFPVGTIIEHHAPTCAPIADVYVQKACTQWTETISIPMTEGPIFAEIPPTGSDLFGLILLAAVLVVAGLVARVVERVKRSGRRTS